MVSAAIDTDKIAAAWLSSREKGLGDIARAAVAWLRKHAPDLAKPIAPVVEGARTDGYLLGAHAAATVIRIDPPDWSTWKPGDTKAAEKVLDESGHAAGLRRLLADADVTITSVADGRFDDLARILAEGLERGDAPAKVAKELRGVLDAPGWAETVAVTETARAVSAAAQDQYKANGIDKNSWLISPDQRVCDLCDTNAAEGPIPVGTRFTSDDRHPPAHPRCRCALMPDVTFDDLDDLDFGDLG